MLNDFIKFIQNPWIIYGGGGLVALLFLWFFYRFFTKSKLNKAIENYRCKYNELSTGPRIKANERALVGEDIIQESDELIAKRKEAKELLSEISYEINECEDKIDLGKYNLAKGYIARLKDLFIAIDDKIVAIDILSKQISPIQSEKNEIRSRINKIKEVYNGIKVGLRNVDERALVNIDAIKRISDEVFEQFQEFEDAMSSGDLAKADALTISIDKTIKNIDDAIRKTPDLINEARVGIPSQIRIVEDMYTKVNAEGCLLIGLQIDKTLNKIKMELENDIELINQGVVSEVDERFKDYSQELIILVNKIRKEKTATVELHKLLVSIKKLIGEASEAINSNKQLADKVYDRYNNSTFVSEISHEESNLGIYSNMIKNIENELSSPQTIASTVLLRLKEFEINFNQYIQNIANVHQEMLDICKDEDDAKRRMISLNFLVNESLVSLRLVNLPSISKRFNEDLARARAKLASVEEVLFQEKLDSERLSIVLGDAEDFIKLFFNRVNEIAGNSKLTESTIVFCNRFRSLSEKIDSDLSNAELLFKDGRYSEALDLVLPIAQKIYPNNYCELIRNHINNDSLYR